MTNNEIVIPAGFNGTEYAILCNFCSKDRKKTNSKCLYVNANTGLYNCKNCGDSGIINSKKLIRPMSEKVYKKPTLGNITSLSKKVVDYFATRSISQETLIKARIGEGEEYMPQLEKKVHTIHFRYFRDGELTNVKYRSKNKAFKLYSGAELIFYNIDAVLNKREIIVTEGEIDTLSFIEAGIDNVVSVPNGANLKTNNLQYLDNCWQYFENVERVFIATDNDAAGNVLCKELARRIGIEKCYRVTFGEFKDANDCLVAQGKDALHEALKNAEEFPLEGIFTAKDIDADIEDYYVNGLPKGVGIGMEEFDELLTFMPGYMTTITGTPSSGKALCIETDIPTVDGWKKMKSIQVGDKIFDENGDIINVIAVTEIMNNRPCYKIIFNDGTEIIADEEHKWLTDTYKSRRSFSNKKRRDIKNSNRIVKSNGVNQSHKRTFAKIVTTKEISVSITATNDNRTNHSIPICQPLNLPKSNLLLSPYMLGLWLGDGNSYGASITNIDTEIIDYFYDFATKNKLKISISDFDSYIFSCDKSLIQNSNGIIKKWKSISDAAKELKVYAGHISRAMRNKKVFAKSKWEWEEKNNRFLKALQKLNLIKNKHIPKEYLRGSYVQRLELLQGLMDTDGHIGKEGDCEFCNTNKTLAEQTLELVKSLGIRATMNIGNATLYGRFISKKYRVQFTPSIPVFKLKRKLNKIKKTTLRNYHRYITSCEKIDSVPVKCIQVDSESHLYLCSKSFIPTHNSEWLDQIISRLSVMHDWKLGLYSPENHPLQLHFSKIAEKIIGKGFSPWNKMNREELTLSKDFFNKHFFFIKPEKDFTLDSILKSVKQLILKHGINAFVIDAWNKLDHKFDGVNEQKYISEQLDKLTMFCEMNNVHFFLVAHPTKMMKDRRTGENEVPTLYSISGSANFYNKTANGICLHRDFNKNNTQVLVQKVKFKHWGKIGNVIMNWDYQTGRYIPDGKQFDKSNWLTGEGKKDEIQLNVSLPYIDKDSEPAF